MRIGMILFSGRPFPPDIRVEKECRALLEDGHEIFILTEQCPGQAPLETCGGCTVVRVKTGLRMVNDPFSYFSLQYRRHKKHIKKFIQMHKPEILHVHDFDLVPSVYRLNRKRLPLVADLHENAPAAFVSYRACDPPLRRFFRSLLYNYRIWRGRERHCLPHVSRVLVVVPEAMERLLEYGVERSRIAVVSNTESEKTFRSMEGNVDETLKQRYRNRWVISYTGGLGPHRGIDTVMRGLKFIGEKIPEILVLVIGARGREKNELMAMARREGVESFVEIIEWLPMDKLHQYLKLSRAALVPHNDFEHTQTTVPHKLFQYMIAGVPVLVSDCRPLKRIIEPSSLGYVFQAGSGESFASAVADIYDNPDEAGQRAVLAKEAALGVFSWEKDARVLRDVYANLEKGNNS